jgi:hypothetical protein
MEIEYRYEPIDQVEIDKWNRRRWKKYNVDKLEDGFTLVRDGRTGSIFYKENPRILELSYELSGSPEFDILIDESGLTKWILPSKDAIDKDKVIFIKKELALWLKNSNTRFSFY